MSKPASFYKTTFQTATSEQQDAFLEQLFERDSDIRNQFEKLIASWDETGKSNTAIVSFIDLEELADEIREELSELNFDMESVYNHFEQGDRSYVPQYEAAYEGAENLIRKEGFEPYTIQAQQFFKKGNLLDGTKVLLAMYEGHNNVYEPGYDEEDVLDDYNDNCLDIFKEEMSGLLFYYKNAEDTKMVHQALDLLVERLVFWQENYQEDLYEDEFIDKNIVYDLSVFDSLFLTVLNNAATATHLKDLLLRYDLKDKSTSKVFLKIASLDTNDMDWIETAETFAQDDVAIMRQLLKHYQEKGKEQDFYRIAKKAFQHFPYQMYKEVFAGIEPEKDQKFYAKVLAYTTKTKQSIEYYRLLRKYLNEDENAKFIAQQINWMDFYVALLAEEKRHEEILAILRKHSASAEGWSSTEGRFETIALHIIDQYPLDCFQLLQQAIDKALKNGRGRGIYATVAKWMAVLLKINGYKAKAQNYIDNIAKEFSNFRALKDEMRKGGVL
ncbi:MAG: hypothetical protein ACI85O_001412 [Saprospiraceae bacterium]|jgi:hypothetical protein